MLPLLKMKLNMPVPPQAGDLLAGSCPLRSDSVVGERTNEKSIKTLTGANEKSTRPLMEAILK